MKKTNNINPKDYDDGMLPEYDFTGKKPIRGKYYRLRQQGYTVRVHNEDGTVTETYHPPAKLAVELDPDVCAFFPDSESVNKALRGLIALIPAKQLGEQKAKYTARKKTSSKPAARK